MTGLRPELMWPGKDELLRVPKDAQRDSFAVRRTDPEPVSALRQPVEVLTEKIRRLPERSRATRSAIVMLERHIAVEALEAAPSSTTPSRACPPRLRPVPEQTDAPTEGNQ